MADVFVYVLSSSFFMHTILYVVVIATTLNEAYNLAFATDTVSPFGGIVIFNQPLDMETARSVDSIFTEIILAPDYQEGVAEFLKEKKNRRLIKILRYPQSESAVKVRTIFGGALYQQADSHILHTSDLKIVTERQPTQAELEDML